MFKKNILAILFTLSVTFSHSYSMQFDDGMNTETEDQIARELVANATSCDPNWGPHHCNAVRDSLGILHSTMAQKLALTAHSALNKRTPIILLDLDNTFWYPDGLVTHPHDKKLHGKRIGSDEWFGSMLDFLKEHPEYCHGQVPIYRAMDLNAIAQSITHVKLVDPYMKFFMEEFQSYGIPVLGLTARSPNIANLTIEKQLPMVKLSFTQSAPFGFARIIERETLSAPTELQPGKAAIAPIFRNGILFCSDNQKGDVFNVILEEVNIDREAEMAGASYWPNLVIYFDDKDRNLQNVKFWLDRLNFIHAKVLARKFLAGNCSLEDANALYQSKYHITFIGIHFTALSDYVHDFVFDPSTIGYLEELEARDEEIATSPKMRSTYPQSHRNNHRFHSSIYAARQYGAI
jgi:hypothetical protein